MPFGRKVDYTELLGGFGEKLRGAKRELILEGDTDYCYAPEYMGNKSIYLKFHPKTRELIVHDGACAKVYADGELIYAYQLFDRFKPGGKRIGGDTHGAITSTRDSVFFGGWAYADVSLKDSNLTFTKKYSHIHRIGVDGRKVDLVWWDGPGTESSYVGEVTDMLFSPKDDAVYFTRADGGSDIWKLDLNTMRVARAAAAGNMYKMELFDDAIVTGGPIWSGSGGAIVVYSLRDGSLTTYTSAVGRYAGSTLTNVNGQVVQYMNSLWLFSFGAVVLFRPKTGERYQFPFFRFSSSPYVAGRRSQKAYVGGTPVVAVNPWDSSDFLNGVAGLLLRFETPVPQIIMPTGCVYGLETDGKRLYIASAPQNHIYRGGNPVNYEPGRGGVFAVPVGEVFKKPFAPVEFRDSIYNWAAYNYYLGVPINGFSRKVLKVNAPAAFTMNVVVYHLWSTPDYDETFNVNLSSGWNTIDLSSYDGLVAAAPTSNVSGWTHTKLILEP